MRPPTGSSTDTGARRCHIPTTRPVRESRHKPERPFGSGSAPRTHRRPAVWAAAIGGRGAGSTPWCVETYSSPIHARQATPASTRRGRPDSKLQLRRCALTEPRVFLTLRFCDKFPEYQGEDAAVVKVAHFRVVVDARVGVERRFLPIVGDSFDLDLLARLDRVDSFDRERLAAGQAERLDVLSVGELQGQDAHPDQHGAVEPLA